MTKDSNPQSREAYYAASATWGADAEHALRRSRHIAWIAAGGIGVIALFEAMALMLLAPLKTVVPYTILVDRQTGFVQAVDPMAPAQLGGQSALTRSFLAQYVVARESYDPATVQANYQKVASWSAGPVRARYVGLMQANNPDSSIARYGRSRTVSATVKSVTALNASTALVRFDTMASDANGTTKALGSWIAIVRFRYRDVPMTVSERLINPLGFTVTSYRCNPDTAPAPTSSAVGAGA